MVQRRAGLLIAIACALVVVSAASSGTPATAGSHGRVGSDFGRIVAADADPPKDLFDDLHARIEAAEKTRQTIRARFTETTTSSLLAKPVVSHGTVIGEKPLTGVLIAPGRVTRMLITYTAPERKTIFFNTDHLVVRRPGQPPERIDIAEIMKTVNKYFTTASPGQLRRAFTIRAFPDPGTPGHYQMELLPKRKEIKQGLERLQIWVTKDYMLSQIKMSFPGGDSDVFELEDVELNVPIPPQTFDVDMPAPARAKKK